MHYRFKQPDVTSILILALVASFCLGFAFKAIIVKQNNSKTTKMKKVTGIGGIFFKCKDPNKMNEWYNTHLGFDTNQYGTNFEWRQNADPTKKGSTQWSPFAETTKYFEPSTKDFMINYRVENLEALVEQLKNEGVTIVDKIEAFEYGKFVHIIDVEGNKVELWEPNDIE
jgi:predicted enzyme related to lactoylglutathione lyase